MASQVPYNPVPNVAAVDRPTPYRSEAIPSGAFGQPQAQARIQEGQTLGQVGNELYARAIAIQEFQQQAEANERDAAFQQQNVKSFVDYTSKRGLDAVNGLDPFLAQQEQVRQQMGQGLSPYGQVLYNNQTRNAYNRMMVSAAVHAKDQQKAYVGAGYQAKIDAANNNLLSNPSPGSLGPNMQEVENSARDYAKVMLGYPDDSDQMTQFIAKEKSKTATNYVMGLAKGNEPIKASIALEKLAKASAISGEDYTKVRAYVDNKMENVQSRVTSSDILAGKAGDWGNKPLDIATAKIGVSAAEGFHGDYSIQGPVVQSGRYAGQRALGKYMVMPGNLSSWLSQAGMPDMTPAQFLNSPDAQEKLFETRFAQRQQALGSFDRALSEWFTGNPNAPMDANDGYNTKAQYMATAHSAIAREAGGTAAGAMARRVAEQQMPGRGDYADRLEHETVAKYNLYEHEKRMDEFNNEQKIADAMTPGLDGKLVTSVEQLTTNPEVKLAFDALKPTKRNQIIERISSNARNGGYQATDETANEYAQLRGLASSPDPEDKQKVLDVDAMSKPWPMSFINGLRAEQARIMKGASADPNVTHAMNVLKPMVDEEYRLSKDEKTMFRGKLQQVMEDQIRSGVEMKEEKIQEIGRNLMKEFVTPSYWWGYNKTKMYQMPMDAPQRQRMIELYKQQHNGQEPSETDLGILWTADLYQHQFGQTPRLRPPSR